MSKKNTINSILFAMFLSFILMFSLFSVASANEDQFDTNLYWGIKNSSKISDLQTFLKDQGLYNGPITGGFYSQTYNAVKNFQKSYGISPASGYFGQLTRNKANEILISKKITNPSLEISTNSNSSLQARVSAAYNQVRNLENSFKKWKNYGNSINNSTSIPITPTPSPTTTPTIPTPPPTTSPVSINTTSSSNEIKFTSYLTAYTYWDNTPPGSADISHPIIHQKAGGTGTFNDPITLAVGHSIINGNDILDYPAGTKFYIPNLRKYFIVEDTCGDGNAPQNGPCHNLSKADKGAQAWLDMWIDGKNATKSVSNSCAEAITANYLVIQNPAPNYAVINGAVMSGSSCPQQYGNTIVTQ